jgi:hypothetical protein
VHVLSGAPALAAADGKLYDCGRQYTITPLDVVSVVDPGDVTVGTASGASPAPGITAEVLVESYTGPEPSVLRCLATAVDPVTGRHTFSLPEGVCVVRVRTRSLVGSGSAASGTSEPYTFVVAGGTVALPGKSACAAAVHGIDTGILEPA